MSIIIEKSMFITSKIKSQKNLKRNLLMLKILALEIIQLCDYRNCNANHNVAS